MKKGTEVTSAPGVNVEQVCQLQAPVFAYATPWNYLVKFEIIRHNQLPYFELEAYSIKKIYLPVFLSFGTPTLCNYRTNFSL